MASNRAYQNDGMSGAFGSDYQGKSLYPEDDISSRSCGVELEQVPYYTDKGFVGMRQENFRHIVEKSNSDFVPPSPVPNKTHSMGRLRRRQPDEATAAFEQFQQREQAQSRGPRDHYAGSHAAASASGYEQPTYPRHPSSAAYERYASNRYRPSGRSSRVSNLRIEVMNNEEDHSSYLALGNQGSSSAFTPGRTVGYRTSESIQQSRQQSGWSQNSAYEGAYGARNIGQANSSISAYQQSSYLLPDQKPHDVTNPYLTFQIRTPAVPGVHAIHSARQGYPTMENARPQPTSNRIGGVDNPIYLSDEAEEPEEEPRRQTHKKKKGPPTHRCATLKKTIHKQGETRWENGHLLWLDPNEPESQQWKPAVVMDDIRKYIIRQQNRVAQALGCSYLYPDESGGEPYGDTAFFFPHRHLGEERHARPDILFTIDETETNNPQPSYDPGWMMYDPVKREISDSGTLIVLNPADNPIVNWKEIPLCISPHMAGFKMEYMRRVNKQIRQRDILARMVNMPSKRFRQKAGCLTWTDRGGSDGLEIGLKELLDGTDVGRQCIAANSMRGFGRDLNGVEQIQVKRGNADGKYLNKAGSRAIDEQTRNERRAKEDERIAKAQRVGDLPMPVPSRPSLPAIISGPGAGSQPAESRKRNRDDEDDSEVSESDVSIQQRPQKRLRPAGKEHSRRTEDDDLAIFDQPQAVVEDPDAAQPYQSRTLAGEEVVHAENCDESSGDSPFEEGGEDVDDGEEESSEGSILNEGGEDVNEDGEESLKDSLFGEDEEDVNESGEESSEDSLFEEGEAPGAGAKSEDDNDPYTPDEIPASKTGDEIVQIEDEEEENNYDEDEDDDEGEVENTVGEPKTGTSYPVPPDPYRQPTSADNAKAGLSDLEGHRKWVRELLDVPRVFRAFF